MFQIPEECFLYAILDFSYLAGRDPVAVALQMIEGGVDIIQLRAKKISIREVQAMAVKVLNVTRPAGIPLMINDYPQVTAEIDADGVHLGQDDISVVEARKMIGRNKWIGKSTHSIQQAMAAQKEGADYIGVGPVFATPTKPDYPPVGLDLVRQASSRLKIPFFCIGGIKLENATSILAAGARRFVVVSGILQAMDMVDYCQNLKAMLKTFQEHA